jgi:hypothetical protein
MVDDRHFLWKQVRMQEVKGTKMNLLQGLKELANRHLARREQPPGPVDAIVRLLRGNDSALVERHPRLSR